MGSFLIQDTVLTFDGTQGEAIQGGSTFIKEEMGSVYMFSCLIYLVTNV